MKLGIVIVACLLLMGTTAGASEQTFQGKVLQTQGHLNPACRMVQVRKTSDGTVAWFRLANTGQDNSMLAITMTALTSGLQVLIDYDPALTTGCGTEPEIIWISLLSGN